MPFIAISIKDEDWLVFKNILVEGRMDDPWFIQYYPSEEERRKGLSCRFERKYNNSIKGGQGTIAFVKDEYNECERIIGGIAIIYHGSYGKYVNDDVGVDEEKDRIRDNLVSKPLKQIATNFGTELWLYDMQAIRTSLQGHGIGTKYFAEAARMIIKNKLKTMKTNGINLRNPPLVYAMVSKDRLVRFMIKSGWIMLGSVEIDLKSYGYGVQSDYVFILPIKGNSDILDAGLNLYKNF